MAHIFRSTQEAEQDYPEFEASMVTEQDSQDYTEKLDLEKQTNKQRNKIVKRSMRKELLIQRGPK